MPNSEDLIFLQITDSHLFENEQQKLIGVDTATSLRAVVAQAGNEENVTGILATGDISQDGSIASYQRFKDIVDPLGAPIHWIPGNHDESKYFHQAGDFPLSSRSVLDIGGWRILLLDSVVPGEDSGHLSSAEMDFIDKNTCDDGCHTLLVLHHQPIPCGSKWLDTMILDNSDDFLALISSKSSIRAVINGHVHQASQKDIDGISFISTPSTCFQFTPDTDDFSLDTLMPGYRRLILKQDGSIETEVVRLSNYDLQIETEVIGY